MVSPSKIKSDEHADTDLDEASMAAIRSLMAEEGPAAPPAETVQPTEQRTAVIPVPKPEKRRTKADAFPVLEAPEADDTHDAPPLARKRSRRRLSLPFKRPNPQRRNATQPVAKPMSGYRSVMVARIKAYRPTPKHIALALLVLLMLLRPWFIVGFIFVMAFVLTAVLLIFGFDGFWRGVVRSVHWYARRRPGRAATVHKRLDTFAMKWDAFLNRFPEGTVDGLYMPDFSEIARAEARHDEAVKRRLAGMSEESV